MTKYKHCNRSQHRRWFLKLETILFSMRYRLANIRQRQQIMSELCGDKVQFDMYSKRMIINNKRLNSKVRLNSILYRKKSLEANYNTKVRKKLISGKKTGSLIWSQK